MEPDGRVKIRDDVFFLKFFKTFSYTQHFPAHEKRNYPSNDVRVKKTKVVVFAIFMDDED